MNEDSFVQQRLRMVSDQIQRRGIRSERVLESMREVPRHEFVLPGDRSMAYEDHPLPIGYEQTISQPYIVAYMTDLLELQGDEVVLDIGTGSGYQAAVLAELARQVYTIERHESLAIRARTVFEKLGYTNISVHVGDGSLGLPEYAPFQAVLVAAAAPQVPQPLLDQLADDGRLVLPVGRYGSQSLEIWQRHGEDYKRRAVLPVAFVPLVGEWGFR